MKNFIALFRSGNGMAVVAHRVEAEDWASAIILCKVREQREGLILVQLTIAA